MCGIVGYIGDKNVDAVILVGLEKLEYRGYDSAGVATISKGELGIRKIVGKIWRLAGLLNQKPLGGNVGIGHTRWATHGEPTRLNAHPHVDCNRRISVVHNGIIENYYTIKEKLLKEGHVFESETDTEVIVHLIEKHMDGNLEKAVFKTVKDLEGSFAFAVICEHDPNKVVAAKSGCPLIVGLGRGENVLASDATPVLSITKEVLDIEEKEICVLEKDKVSLFNFDGKKVERKPRVVEWDVEMTTKDGYDHFMLKEIYEQPRVIRDNIRRRINDDYKIDIASDFNLTNGELARVSRIIIQACGTSWHASLVGKYLLEHYCRIHTEVDISSEFRYRNPVADGETYVMAVSQSGETADVIAGIRSAKAKFLKVLSICNVMGSTVARECDGVVYTHAGPEIGVASTKAFTAQLLSFYFLTFYLAKIKWLLSDDELKRLLDELKTISDKMEKFLNSDGKLNKIAKKFYNAKNFVFLGRGINYPLALEGALKLKEISYLHATGYPAGEMKHGPIALVDEKMPVVCIVPKSSVYDKMVSNIQEVKARKGRIIAVATEGDKKIKSIADYVIYIPEVSEIFSPLVVALPLQLLAYKIAVMRKCDVDKPRNLAKSVTVE